jgi:DNA primase
MPVTWGELKKAERADDFTLETAPQRKDAWGEKFFSARQRIGKEVIAYLKKENGQPAVPGKKGTGKA